MESGPKAGEKVGELKVFAVAGPVEGKEVDYAAERKDAPTVYLFVNAEKFDRPMARLLKTVDGKLGEVDDKALALDVQASVAHGMGEALTGFRGEIRVRLKGAPADFGMLVLEPEHLTQSWIHGRDVRLRIYRERSEGAHGAVELVLEMERQFGQVDIVAPEHHLMHRRVRRRHFDDRLRIVHPPHVFVDHVRCRRRRRAVAGARTPPPPSRTARRRPA